MEVIDNRKEGVVQKIADNKIVKKLKKIKNIQIIAAVFIIAVSLLIYSTVMTSRKDDGDGTPAASESMDEEENRLAAILASIEGAGRVQTMITRRGDEIVGVLVLAEGADDITVMLRLLSATTTVLDIDKSAVEIYRMK